MRMEIQYLFVSDCKDCEAMLFFLKKAVKELGLDSEVDIKKYCCDEDKNGNIDEESLDLAIDNGFDDLPACIIGTYTFCGKNHFEYDEIMEAIAKVWREQS